MSLIQPVELFDVFRFSRIFSQSGHEFGSTNDVFDTGDIFIQTTSNNNHQFKATQ